MQDKIKFCKFCGAKLEQREREPQSYFKKRKYCNTMCARAGQKRDGHWRHDLNLTSRREF